MQRFIEHYPGTVHAIGSHQDTSLPLWMGVQDFFNLFLLVFVIRSGPQILSDQPRLYWTRHSTPSREWFRFRFQKPVPADPSGTATKDFVTLPAQAGLPGIRPSIGLARWWHLGAGTLWLLNGLVFYALLFATGQWRRVVPTSWEIVPNAASVLIQYLSLNWPTENGRLAYNGSCCSSSSTSLWSSPPACDAVSTTSTRAGTRATGWASGSSRPRWSWS